MDQNSENQNIDGIKPNDSPQSTSGMDGFVTNPRPNSPAQNEDYTQVPEDTAAQGIPPQAAVPVNPKTGKGVKIWLVIFIVLFAAAAAAAAMFYLQSKQYKDDLNTKKQNVSQLQKEVDDLNKSTEKSQVDSLTSQNANLQKTINAQKAYITTLTKAAQDLKTKCGTSCSSITIPADTTTTTTNP